MKYKAPCKDCEKRYIGCHSHCEDYIKFRKDLDKHNAEIQEQRKEIRMDIEARKRRMDKLRARRGGKR